MAASCKIKHTSEMNGLRTVICHEIVYTLKAAIKHTWNTNALYAHGRLIRCQEKYFTLSFQMKRIQRWPLLVVLDSRLRVH